MDDDINRAKYQKYKAKYLQLKDILDQTQGGASRRSKDLSKDSQKSRSTSPSPKVIEISAPKLESSTISEREKDMMKQIPVKNPLISDSQSRHSMPSSVPARPSPPPKPSQPKHQSLPSDSKSSTHPRPSTPPPRPSTPPPKYPPKLPSKSQSRPQSPRPSAEPQMKIILPSTPKTSPVPKSNRTPIQLLLDEFYNHLKTYQDSVTCCQGDINSIRNNSNIDQNQRKFLDIIWKAHGTVKWNLDQIMRQYYPNSETFLDISKDVTSTNLDQFMKDNFYDLFKQYTESIRDGYTQISDSLNKPENRNIPYYYLENKLRIDELTSKYSGDSKKYFEELNMQDRICNNKDCLFGSFNTRFLKFRLLFDEMIKKTTTHESISEMHRLAVDTALIIQAILTNLQNSRVNIDLLVELKENKPSISQNLGDTNYLKSTLTNLSPQVNNIYQKAAVSISSNASAINKTLNSLEK